MFRAIKQHVTRYYHRNLRHGMILLKAYNKSPLLTMSQKGIENAQKDMGRLQIITVSDLSGNNIRLQCLELSNNMLQELIMANKGMA